MRIKKKKYGGRMYVHPIRVDLTATLKQGILHKGLVTPSEAKRIERKIRKNEKTLNTLLEEYGSAKKIAEKAERRWNRIAEKIFKLSDCGTFSEKENK